MTGLASTFAVAAILSLFNVVAPEVLERTIPLVESQPFSGWRYALWLINWYTRLGPLMQTLLPSLVAVIACWRTPITRAIGRPILSKWLVFQAVALCLPWLSFLGTSAVLAEMWMFGIGLIAGATAGAAILSVKLQHARVASGESRIPAWALATAEFFIAPCILLAPWWVWHRAGQSLRA